MLMKRVVVEADEVSPCIRNTAGAAAIARTPRFLSPITASPHFCSTACIRSTSPRWRLACRTMLGSRATIQSRCWRAARRPFTRYLHDLHHSLQSKFLRVSEEVRDAVETGKPVVALETTIYTHGMCQSNNAKVWGVWAMVRTSGSLYSKDFHIPRTKRLRRCWNLLFEPMVGFPQQWVCLMALERLE